VKTLRIFESEDGERFDTEAECKAHEDLCSEIEKILDTLSPLPEDDALKFVNGEGYIQHDAATVASVRVALLKIAQRYSKNPPWFQQAIDDPSIHSSWASRLIGDACPSPLYEAWNRIACIDKSSREWGQPFFAEHPDEASGQFEIKGRRRERL
jgi:hypothetical protein